MCFAFIITVIFSYGAQQMVLNLAVVRFGSSHTSPTLSRHPSVSSTGDTQEPYDSDKAWSFINHSIFSSSPYAENDRKFVKTMDNYCFTVMVPVLKRSEKNVLF
jgi:hypothetical protein